VGGDREREREREKFIDYQIDDWRSVSTTPLAEEGSGAEIGRGGAGEGAGEEGEERHTHNESINPTISQDPEAEKTDTCVLFKVSGGKLRYWLLCYTQRRYNNTLLQSCSGYDVELYDT
jgi:hypothetical protein